MTIGVGLAASVVAGQGALLVAASPGGPVQPVADGVDGVRDQFREQVPDFVNCQRNQLGVGVGALLAFVGGDDREQGMGEHDQGGVAVPGVPLADLVLVQTDLSFAGLETLLYRPAGAG